MLTASLWYAEIGGPGCWEWRGAKDTLGYGQVRWGHKLWRAHRLHWVAVNGPLPKELVIDHLCRNIACIRLSHLEPVTQRENVRRGLSAQPRRTHCPRGHSYSGYNLKIISGTGQRQCRACVVRTTNEWRAKKKALALRKDSLSAPAE